MKLVKSIKDNKLNRQNVDQYLQSYANILNKTTKLNAMSRRHIIDEVTKALAKGDIIGLQDGIIGVVMPNSKQFVPKIKLN